MVVVAKGRLLALLKAVPELLPYQHSLDGNVDSSLYEGIWGEIRKEEWKNSLHM